MVRKVLAVGCLAISLGLAGCGGSEESRGDGLGSADWTLTIISPDHGSDVGPDARVEVALTGPAAARGETPDFDVGFFVDDQLVKRGSDLAVDLSMPLGSHSLRVTAIDGNGTALPDVVGDVIDVNVIQFAGQPPFTVPSRFSDINVRLGGNSLLPVGNVQTPPVDLVPPSAADINLPPVTPPTGGR